jgi:hypothetical protein
LFASTLAGQTSQTAHRRRIEATGAHRAVGDRLQERLPAIEIVGFAQPLARRRQPPSFSTRRENALFFGLNRLGRRFNKGRGVPMLTAEERPVDPYDRTTQTQAADLIIRPDKNEYESEHSYDLDPWQSRRTRSGGNDSLDRLPNDAKLHQRAAEFLRKQGKEDLAREREVRGQ